MRWVGLLVVLAGCSSSSIAPQGGDAGARPPVAVWVDATGAVVGPYASGSPVFFDAAGFQWSVDRDAARASAVGTGAFYFSSADCSGSAYLAANVLPRQTIRVAGDSTVYSLPDDAMPATRSDLRSVLGFSGCEALVGTAGVIPKAQARVVVGPPALSFMPPLHVEAR